MLKFYSLQSTLVKSVMEGLKDEDVDFPFRVSPSEQRIIELKPTSSIILVGARLLTLAPCSEHGNDCSSKDKASGC